MRQEIPEINPSGADIKDVWEMTADMKGFYLSLVENDDVIIVRWCHKFRDLAHRIKINVIVD